MVKNIFKFIAIFFLGGLAFMGSGFLFLKYKMNEQQSSYEEKAKIDLDQGKNEFLDMPTLELKKINNNSDLNLELLNCQTMKKENLMQHKGKLIVINQWATWCSPCIAELPYFDKLKKETSTENIVFMFLSSEKVEAITKFKGKKNYALPFYQAELLNLDSTSIFETSTIPMTIIINPNQEFYLKSTGSASWYSKELKDFVVKMSKN